MKNSIVTKELFYKKICCLEEQLGNQVPTGGTAGQFLQTDGAGNLSWASVVAGDGNGIFSAANDGATAGVQSVVLGNGNNLIYTLGTGSFWGVFPSTPQGNQFYMSDGVGLISVPQTDFGGYSFNMQSNGGTGRTSVQLIGGDNTSSGDFKISTIGEGQLQLQLWRQGETPPGPSTGPTSNRGDLNRIPVILDDIDYSARKSLFSVPTTAPVGTDQIMVWNNNVATWTTLSGGASDGNGIFDASNDGATIGVTSAVIGASNSLTIGDGTSSLSFNHLSKKWQLFSDNGIGTTASIYTDPGAGILAQYNAGVQNNTMLIDANGFTFNVNAATPELKITSSGLTINNVYTLPMVDGTAGQVLSTDGAGNLSWVTP